jgi:hypothetical protein
VASVNNTGVTKMHKMYYNEAMDVYVHVFGDRSAMVKAWSNVAALYVQEDGRDLAARALKNMRIQKIDIKQQCLATPLRPLGR